MRISIEDMIDIETINDNGDFLPGVYKENRNKKPISGLKVKAEKGSLLEQLEIKAKGKFKLENDSENYAQEARVLLSQMIDKYYELNDCSEDEDVAKWLYTAVDRKLIDLAKTTKGNASYYDREKGEYIINQIEYFGDYHDGSILEGYVNNIKLSSMEESKIGFLKWFDDNKENILTRKQLDYLDNKEVDLKNVSRLHRNIVKRVDAAYHDDSVNSNKNRRMEAKINLIQDLLDCYDLEYLSDMIRDIVDINDFYFVIEGIYEELNLKDCVTFTKILKGEENVEKSMYYKIFNILIDLENKLKNV